MFVGVPPVAFDARIALQLTDCAQATLRNSHFYGIACMEAGSAVLSAAGCNLRLENTSFRGCTGNSGRGAPVVLAEDWRGLSVTGCDFIDYGTLNKIGRASCRERV